MKRVEEGVERASISGFRGLGEAGRLKTEREMSKGKSRRLSGVGGLGFGLYSRCGMLILGEGRKEWVVYGARLVLVVAIQDSDISCALHRRWKWFR